MSADVPGWILVWVTTKINKCRTKLAYTKDYQDYHLLGAQLELLEELKEFLLYDH